MNRNDNIYHIVLNGICTGCGICEGACPHNAITTIIKQGRFLPKIDASKCKNDKGCHRCYDACSGHGIDLVRMSKELYADTETKENALVGRYLYCFTGHSNDYDIRYHSASGGMVSQFLIWLLKNDKIDGAIVTKFDKDNPLLVKTFLATTREEIISARSSKYAPVTLNRAVQDIKKAIGQRYVVVGLPCHIQSIRKLMSIDKQLQSKIYGLFAIYCSSGRTFYLTEHVLKERGIKKENLTYFAYRDEGCLGSLIAKQKMVSGVYGNNSDTSLYKEDVIYKERYQSYYHPLRSFFIPRRCLFCIDHYGELGDICFGDIHIKPYSDDKVGVNSFIVRSRIWLDYLFEAQKDGSISLEEVPFQIVSDSQKMSFKKKGRNGAFVNIGKKMGWVMPQYDVSYLRQPTLHDWLDYFQNRFQQFLGNHKSLWWLVSLLKSETTKLK